MDKPTKSVLIVIGSILLVWVCVTVFVTVRGLFSGFFQFADQGIHGSPQMTVRFGSEIADFEVPAGFGNPSGIHFGDGVLISYKSADEKYHLLLAQFPQRISINLDEMLRIIRDGSNDPGSIWYKTQMKLIDQYSVIIRGGKCTFNISDGINRDGVEFRMATAKFDGRGGPALVMIVGPGEDWNGEMVEAFVGSIK